jgi:hypothetical protein
VLAYLNDDMKAKVMFMWLRDWHYQNDCIFGEGDTILSHAANFVKNYYASMYQIKNGNDEMDRKFKRLVVSIDAVDDKKKAVE